MRMLAQVGRGDRPGWEVRYRAATAASEKARRGFQPKPVRIPKIHLDEEFFKREARCSPHWQTADSTCAGSDSTFQDARRCFVSPNCEARLEQSAQCFTWSKTDCAWAVGSSPSRKAITSSGATGCVAVFIRVPQIR